MNGPITGKNIGKEIADALGIKYCRSLKIDIPSNGLITVEAEFYPEIEGVQQFPAILKRFELMEKKEENLEGEYGLDGPNDKKVSWEEHTSKLVGKKAI